MLALVRTIAPDLMPDPVEWLRDGYLYVASHYRLVVAFVVAELLIAVSLAALVAVLLGGGAEGGNIERRSGWTRAFRSQVPEEAERLAVVELQDGSA